LVLVAQVRVFENRSPFFASVSLFVLVILQFFYCSAYYKLDRPGIIESVKTE